jgi:hypothetical protein
MDWVIERFYPVIPNTVKFILMRDDAEKFLQTVYDEVKDFLDGGHLNDST